MRKSLILAPLLVLLGGCQFSTNIPAKTQEAWRGRPISDLQKAIGSGEGFSVDEKQYYRQKEGNFLTSGSGSPLGGYVTKSCELRVYVDNEDKITRFDTYNKGLNCAHDNSDLKQWVYLHL